MSRLPSPALCLILLAACGDDGPGQSRDASVADTAQNIDAVASNCSYVEQADADNDDTASGSPEATNLTFSTSKDTVLCGTLDASHFDGSITVDVDAYLVTFATDVDVLVRMKGAGTEAIEYAGVDVLEGSANGKRIGTATFYGDHGVTSVHVPAGTYDIQVFALHSEAIATSVPYTIAIIADTPALRCPELTTGGYPEANDGGSSNGNDVLTIPTYTGIALTSSGSDNPEPTNLTLSPANGDQRISGMAANITTTDLYEDKDTYAFVTSSMTNELTVRLAWQGTTTNLDYLLFEQGQTDYAQVAIASAQQGPEAQTFSIKPSTNYWLLVGSKAGTAMPAAAYNVSLCPTHFTP